MKSHKYRVSDKRRAEFEQQVNEDPYQWISRQIDMATPFEATWLFYMRARDEAQQEAWKFHQVAKATLWSRWTVVAAMTSNAISVALFAASLILQ